jgi:hypothetical protein
MPAGEIVQMEEMIHGMQRLKAHSFCQ